MMKPKPTSTPSTASTVVETKKMSDIDRQFLPAAIEIMESPPSPIRVWLIWTIVAFFGALLIWSWFGKLDIYAIAPGKVQPIGRSKIVQPLEAAKVTGVLVENGMHVSEGQSLVVLDSTEIKAEQQALNQELESTNAEITRRKAAISLAGSDFSEPVKIEFPRQISSTVRNRELAVLAADLSGLEQARKTLTSQLEENDAAKRRLAASIAARQKLILLSQERIDMRQSLKNLGVGSRAQVIEAQQQFESTVVTDISERGQLKEAEATQQTTQQKLAETVSRFVVDQAQKLSDAERKADKLTQDIVKTGSRYERTTLRAPIGGYVQELSVTTIGQVLPAGQTVLSIVPEDAPMEIEVLIGNQDIGFVELGQKATIKLDAFPFTRYGTLEGTVAKLSRDAIDEETISDQQSAQSRAVQPGQGNRKSLSRPQRLVFPAIIVLKDKFIAVDGKNVLLVPGMAVAAEIKTGSRRAIDYLLSPLREATARIGSER